MKQLTFTDSLLAGFAIGIAGLIYLSIYPWNNLLAALCFSIGLMIVILEDYHLYTGKIGFIDKYQLSTYPVCLLGNIVGVGAVALFALNHPTSVILVEAKLSYSLIEIFFKAIGCGFLMYVAVNGKTFEEKILRAIICVFGFIVTGFEHSIADIFYFLTAERLFETKSLLFILIVILGNSLGSFLGGIRKWQNDLQSLMRKSLKRKQS